MYIPVAARATPSTSSRKFEFIEVPYSIADIATFPWVRNLIGFYSAGDLVGFADFPHVARALAAFVARPAVTRGLAAPKRA